jgi:dTDP-4-amino-4,6-dideoxygalactose transaminase
LVQLGKLGANNELRRLHTERYQKYLRDSGVGLPFTQKLGQPAYHLLPMLLPDGIGRSVFMDHMKTAGIQTSIHYPPVHCFTYYRKRYADTHLPVTEGLAEREVTLPLYPTMSTADIDLVVGCVRQSLEKSRVS